MRTSIVKKIELTRKINKKIFIIKDDVNISVKFFTAFDELVVSSVILL